MIKFLEFFHEFVWGIPALVLILGVGLYLSIASGWSQFLLFPRSFVHFMRRFTGRRESASSQSPFESLCTALAATVGTGNLVGVAGAISLGGPGAVFWMWIAAFLGLMTKFAEVTLAVRYRERNLSGEIVGGPMYMIRNGLGHCFAWLATVYCCFGVVASFGVGNAAQINAMLDGFNGVIHSFGMKQSVVSNLLVGVCLSLCIGVLLFSGAKRIGAIAKSLVPVSAALYILMCVAALYTCRLNIADAVCSIFAGAFSPAAITGGMIGSAFTSMRMGVSRGVFTNEAGMGTASIAHVGADVSHPVEQGLMGIMEVFLDTLLICTLTALVILSSGVPISYGIDKGADLTAAAFSAVFGEWIRIPLAVFLACFAFATVLGWSLYGARCAQFIFGHKVWKPYALLQAACVIPAAIMKTNTVWLICDTVNGLMAIPNLTALTLLSPELIHLIKDYRIHRGRASAHGGTYENFNQC